MKKFRDYYNASKATGEIGIEIETESSTHYDIPRMTYWTAHNDGSLRNHGVEYVFSRPLDYNSPGYTAALKEFDGIVEAIGKDNFLKSTYSSVHVHFNFLELPVVAVANFITTYLIFEKTLTKYCGPDRDGNLFCLKTSDAESLLEVYHSVFRGVTKPRFMRRAVMELNNSSFKYSGLNVVPLRTFGSMEVRTHPGTIDTEEIHKWVSILYRLYSYSSKLKNPREFLEILRVQNINEVGLSIFGDLWKALPIDTIEEDYLEGLYYIKNLVYEIKDWEKFGIGTTPLPPPVFVASQVLTSELIDAGVLDRAYIERAFPVGTQPYFYTTVALQEDY